MVSFARGSATAMENGDGDIARCLSSQFIDRFHSFASVTEAAVGSKPVRCFSADCDLSYVDRDAASHSVVKTLAQSSTRKERKNAMKTKTIADLILHNGRITTLDPKYPEAKNVVVRDGRILGVDDAESYERGPNTKVIDLNGRRVIPGLNDSHLHVIRGGLNYNMELRWDGVPSLADAMRMLKEQVQRTPPGQWVRVVGGWTEFQFAERRMLTLEEINAVAPETPILILHLYCRALLNQAALRACGYTKDTRH